MSDFTIKPLHCAMSVGNLGEAINWFEKNLNFTLVSTDDVPPAGFKLAFVRSGDFEIELFEHYESKPAPEESHDYIKDIQTRGTKHLCFGVDDLDALTGHLKENGVAFAVGPQMTLGFYMCYVYGPDNILIELIQKPDMNG